MIAGIPGIRAAGSSQKGEKGEFGIKGKPYGCCFSTSMVIINIFPRREGDTRFKGRAWRPRFVGTEGRAGKTCCANNCRILI